MDRVISFLLDDHPFFGFLVILLVIVAVAGSAVTGAIYAIGPRSCDGVTSGLNVPHRWSFWGGCQVQIYGQWVLYQNVVWLPNGTVEVKP